jgi:uncharacterized protein (TIRG00374 family)
VRAAVVFWTNLAVGAALLAFVLHGYGGEALAVLRQDPSALLLMGFLASVVATVAVLSWRWGFVLGGVCRPITLPRLVLYRSAAHVLAVLVPSGKVGGDPLRAWLAARAGIAPGDAIASVAVDRTLEIGSTARFSILFATLLVQHGVPQLERALVTVVVATAGLGLGLVIVVRRLRRGAGLVTALARRTRLDRFRLVGSQMNVIEASEAAAHGLVEQPSRMLVGFFAGLVANLLVVAEFALLLSAFGLPLEAVAVVGAIFATGAAHLLPVPAGVGVLEGAHMWMFEMLGYSADIGLAVGLAVRFRELVWMAPGVLYFLGRSVRSSRPGLPAA